MKIDRMDTIDGVTYIMTETHCYTHVLPVIKEFEANILPIKHVNAERAVAETATGYKVPKTSSIDKIVEVLKGAAV